MSEQEICSSCGQPKPIALILRPPKGEDQLLCRECSETWLDSEEEWPPETKKRRQDP